MILNSLQNQFVVQFPKNFFYTDIHKKWGPIVRRMRLPYQSLEDFMNASVQAITFPDISIPTAVQQQTQFQIKYRGGKELEPVLNKEITVTFKLTEGFISYWILFEQVEKYLEYRETPAFWPAMYVSFLDHHGFELVAFTFEKIVPLSLSQFTVSYATTAAQFSSFTLGLRFNRFKIKRRIEEDPSFR